jgi:hypothetical protein
VTYRWDQLVFANLPPVATFLHAGARDGFEAVCFRQPLPTGDGYLLEGGTTAIEDSIPWSVQYRIEVDRVWRTMRAEAIGVSPLGHHTLHVECRDGRWVIDGSERPDLDGCVDIDFESSVVTNTLAVHRLDPSPTALQDVPAAFVRADDLRVERVEQSYLCTSRTEDVMTFDYTSSTFDFACQLVFDGSGIVTDYPGIGRRHS